MLHVGELGSGLSPLTPRHAPGYDPSPRPIGVIMWPGVKLYGTLPLSVPILFLLNAGFSLKNATLMAAARYH